MLETPGPTDLSIYNTTRCPKFPRRGKVPRSAQDHRRERGGRGEENSLNTGDAMDCSSLGSRRTSRSARGSAISAISAVNALLGSPVPAPDPDPGISAVNDCLISSLR